MAAAALGLVLTLSASGAPASSENDRAATRADMRAIYASLRVLLPLSVDEAAFRSPDQRERIRSALSTLAERARRVADHAGSGDRRVEYLGGALSREAEKARKRFDAGEVRGARFFVGRLTDFCVACHSRLPSLKDSELTRGFVDESQLAALPLEQRAELEVATRRFDDALASYERVIDSPTTPPADLLSPITGYLTVAIRVKGDYVRPIATLQRLGAREDLWTQLRDDVDRWTRTLEAQAARPPSEPTLAAARAWLEQGRQIRRYPTDRQALVHDLLASSLLHRYLERRDGQADRDVAEAYYWLGLVESRVDDGDWLSEADFFLETAIRTAPTDPIAKRAFALLEERAVLGWTGSSGSHMPAAVQSNLAELRALVESPPEGDRGE